MNKNMKGFTLVELLAVIVILAIVLIIAVPGVLSIINSTKQKGYESQLKMIKAATRNYVTAETSKISWIDQSDGTKQVIVKLTELQANGYLDKKIIDPRDKSVISCADVTVKRDIKNRISYGVDTSLCKSIVPKCFTFDKETGTITDYDETCTKSVKIPSEIDGTVVTTIGGWAFYGKRLTSVIIPNSVTTIDYRAFERNQLTSVTLGNSVTTIADQAFQVNELTSLVIPNSVTVIGPEAFGYNQLTSVTIGDSVTTIGYAAFYNNQLTSVMIGKNVTWIGSAAFGYNQLTSVTIGDSVTGIGYEAFFANRLRSVMIGKNVTRIGYAAFNGNMLDEESAIIYERNVDGTEDKRTIVSYGGKQNYVEIPNGVISIGESAFKRVSLSTVVIPGSVETIGSRAFSESGRCLGDIIIQGKSALSEFYDLAPDWYTGCNPTITFEP